MREIKFRAWDKAEKTWLEFEEIFIDQEGEIYLIEERTWAYQSYMHTENITEKVEIMQYTGLKDKNGKEIYEGDILEVKPNYLFKIIWHEESWGYEVIINDAVPVCGYIKGHISRGGLKHYNNSSTVIGNIHENPELLQS